MEKIEQDELLFGLTEERADEIQPIAQEPFQKFLSGERTLESAIVESLERAEKEGLSTNEIRYVVYSIGFNWGRIAEQDRTKESLSKQKLDILDKVVSSLFPSSAISVHSQEAEDSQKQEINKSYR